VRRFLIVIEEAKGNFSAFSPDLPGCVATGKTRHEVEQNMDEALQFHVQGLMDDDLPVPTPTASAEYVAVP